jgi:para-aminobenzoate synthetase component 1
MIVDLERNDLSRVAVTGSVEVESLYDVRPWSGLWHAGSLVAATLSPDATTDDVLRRPAAGGSVTGAPKRAACVAARPARAGRTRTGHGRARAAVAGGLELGLTIRTIAVDEQRVHLWAGGGITWGSDPAAEVAEALAKAGPLLAALSSDP